MSSAHWIILAWKKASFPSAKGGETVWKTCFWAFNFPCAGRWQNSLLWCVIISSTLCSSQKKFPGCLIGCDLGCMVNYDFLVTEHNFQKKGWMARWLKSGDNFQGVDHHYHQKGWFSNHLLDSDEKWHDFFLPSIWSYLLNNRAAKKSAWNC